MTPLARSNAAHAAAASALEVKPVTRWKAWSDTVRKILRHVRARAVEQRTWTCSKWEAVPQPAWKVAHAHSTTMQRVYERMQLIGKGEHNRAAIGAKSEISGREVDGRQYDYLIRASVGAIAILEGLPVTTVKRALVRLAAVHSIIPLAVRTQGEKGESNREATVWRLPLYAAVIEARKADPAIATTHDGRLQWNNGRANSRRLLTPEQAERWTIAQAVPAPPESDYTPTTTAVPATAAPPVAEARPVRTVAAINRDAIPEAVQKAFDELQGNGGKPVFCDLAPVIIRQLRETAARHGMDFPVDGAVECCTWFLEKAGKEKLATRPGFRDAYRWKVGSVGGYLKHVTADDHDTEGGENWKTVVRFVERYEKAKRKADTEAHEQIARCLQLLRKTPRDKSCHDWGKELSEKHPEMFDAIWSEDDRRHGGDGRGSSWAKAALAVPEAMEIPGEGADFAKSLISGVAAKVGELK